MSALCSSEDAMTVQRQNKQIPSGKDLILILVTFAKMLFQIVR